MVQAFIDRINCINPILNCVVDKRFKLALNEAKEIDKLIQSRNKSESQLESETPFLGVPFTIKDCFAVEGTVQFFDLQFKLDNILFPKV